MPDYFNIDTGPISCQQVVFFLAESIEVIAHDYTANRRGPNVGIDRGNNWLEVSQTVLRANTSALGSRSSSGELISQRKAIRSAQP